MTGARRDSVAYVCVYSWHRNELETTKDRVEERKVRVTYMAVSIGDLNTRVRSLSLMILAPLAKSPIQNVFPSAGAHFYFGCPVSEPPECSRTPPASRLSFQAMLSTEPRYSKRIDTDRNELELA